MIPFGRIIEKKIETKNTKKQSDVNCHLWGLQYLLFYYTMLYLGTRITIQPILTVLYSSLNLVLCLHLSNNL